MQTTFNIKSESADKLREIAPLLGLTASDTRRTVAPGVEQITLDPFTAMKFDAMRKRARLGADAMIERICRNVAKATA